MGVSPFHSVFLRKFPFVRAYFLWPFLALWILSTAWLIVRFRALDSDSIMYGLPLAFSKGPFSLFIPMIGDWPPYSTVWGHQWPGAMWLRGALFSVVPFERWLDISLLLGMQFLAAGLAGNLVWSLTKAPIASLCAVFIILSDRIIIAGVQLHRFEALVILALVALFLALAKTTGQNRAERNSFRGWLLVAFGGAFVAACSHPFGMAIAAGFAVMAGFDWVILRRRAAVAALIPAMGLMLGLGSVSLYYFLEPEARTEFLQNVALQSSFNNGSRLAFLAQLRYYHGVGYALWGAAVIAAPYIFFCLVRRRSDQAFVAWALPLSAVAVPALYFITRSANNNYLTLGTPFAAILVATAIGLMPRNKWHLIRLVFVAALCLLAVGFMSVYPYRWYVFVKSGRPDFPAEMQALINRMPQGVRVYIPPPLWDAARKDSSRDYRLYTLSIASPWETRLAYEKKVYGEVKTGDLLVIDRLSGKTGDPWGILPTFETLPADARYWQPVFEAVRRIPGSGNDFGYDLAVYEFRGAPWNPQETPRKSILGR